MYGVRLVQLDGHIEATRIWLVALAARLAVFGFSAVELEHLSEAPRVYFATLGARLGSLAV